MTNAIFTTKVNPTYDDLPEERYHFPRTYLNQAQQAIGDWIVYYEPRRLGAEEHVTGGRQCYIAIARVREIVPDPQRSDHFYALVSDYLEFPRPVPFKEAGNYYESVLRKPDGSTNKGAFGRAVRGLPTGEYERILQAAFARPLGHGAEQQEDLPMVSEPEADYGRPVIQQVQNRLFRDRAFRLVVAEAYGHSCAMTGLQLVNGGGRLEVEAAHIRPVEAFGPDSIRNGIALSRTMHWMFDHGIVSIEDDGKLLLKPRMIPEQVRSLLHPSGYVTMPEESKIRPHPQFLRYHRENVFDG